MPGTTEKILTQLNAPKRTYEELDSFGLYPSGNKVTEKPEILFARLDITLDRVLEKVEAMRAQEAKEQEPNEEETAPVVDIEAKPEVTFDDFMKMQFQVGRDHCLRRGEKIQKASLFSGKNRKPGEADRIRNQIQL